MNKSKWEDYYRRYRMLLRTWTCPGTDEVITRQAFETVVISPKEPELCLQELHRRGFDGPDSEQWKEALELRGAIQDMFSEWLPDEPLEDVYQAALLMETFSNWHGDQENWQLYRGQRNHLWRVIPALFRRSTPTVAESQGVETDFRIELSQICGYVRLLQANGHNISDEEGVAIVQHYSSEIKAPTWLIDFTWDPFVALFFASDGGLSGDIGKVSYLKLGEWKKLSADGINRLGSVRIIEPKGVPRIVAQKALFLDTSHPDLLEQYVPHTLYFKQKPGIVFEDPTRYPPIERSAIYPDLDPFRDELKKGSPLANVKPLEYLPASEPRVPLNAEDYLEIVESWYRCEKKNLTPMAREVLGQVCMIYASKQTVGAREKIDIPDRSLYRLREAVDDVRSIEAYGLDEALCKTLIEELIRRIKSGYI